MVRREWGADRRALKSLYTGVVRATLDYGAILYCLAADTFLKKLDKIHYRCLVLCTGACQSTSTATLNGRATTGEKEGTTSVTLLGP